MAWPAGSQVKKGVVVVAGFRHRFRTGPLVNLQNRVVVAAPGIGSQLLDLAGVLA